jgi:hypothetical protein
MGTETQRQFYPFTRGQELTAVENEPFDVPAWRESQSTKLDTITSRLSNVVSTDNSHSTLITDGSNFTGAWEEVSQYDSVVVAVKTDQNGYFEVQFSPDGTNQDSTLTRYYRTTQIEAPHRFTITRSYFRVVFYNNSGADQTFFRLQTTIGAKAELNAPLDSTLAQDFDSISVRPSSYHTEVATGRRQGATLWNKFGYNLDIDNTEELIASWGGTFQFLTTGETIDIVSSSANDTDGGTGCHGLVIYGVDENWDTVTEVVMLTGTTPITTTSSWLGIDRISAFRSGSTYSNVGEIDITATTSGYQMAQMPAAQGTSQQCIFYVPKDHKFLAEWLHFTALKTSGGGKPEITVLGYVFSAVSNTIYEVYRGAMDINVQNELDVNPPVPFVIGEKSILWFTCDTDTANTSIKGRFSGELIRDADS